MSGTRNSFARLCIFSTLRGTSTSQLADIVTQIADTRTADSGDAITEQRSREVSRKRQSSPRPVRHGVFPFQDSPQVANLGPPPSPECYLLWRLFSSFLFYTGEFFVFSFFKFVDLCQNIYIYILLDYFQCQKSSTA